MSECKSEIGIEENGIELNFDKKKKTEANKRVSPLWLHFEDDGKSASCLYCKSKLIHHSSTTPLKNHLTAKHPEMLPPNISSNLRIPSKRNIKETIDQDLVKALVRDLRPLSESEGALCNLLNNSIKGWEIPKRESLHQILELLYMEYYQKV